MTKQRSFFTLLITMLTVTLCYNCKQKITELLWTKSIYLVGSPSSPRAADLNKDGIKDIVIGAGKGELDSLDAGVIALDGLTGEILWQQKSYAQMFGSATFLDITGDSISDVIINGRKHNLKALNGRSGDVIWEYKYKKDSGPILQLAKYNFYNATIIPDQDNDGIDDILTINGGNWDALPNSNEDRFPAVLMAFSSRLGDVIRADTMPDSNESYMSPVIYPAADELHIIYGTGGETTGGNLFTIGLEKFLIDGLAESKILLSEIDHGYIASPSLADLNKDGIMDIIVVSHASRISALDGLSSKLLWRFHKLKHESSNALAVGQFNADGIPDLFAVISKGRWPEYTMSLALAIDGTDGSLIYQDSSSCFELSSPVCLDIDNNGIDEVFLNQNIYDCENIIDGNDGRPLIIDNQLVTIDISNQKSQVIDHSKGFKNIYSTPWIGDLDNDNYADIVYCQYASAGIDIARFTGMRVKRISTDITLKNPVYWGEFLGKDGQAVYNTNE